MPASGQDVDRADTSAVVQSDFEQQYRDRKMSIDRSHRNADLQLKHTNQNQEAMVEHMRQVKEITKVLKELLPSPEDLPHFAEQLKDAGTELTEFAAVVAQFMKQITSSCKDISEVSDNVAILVKKIDRNYMRNVGIIKWNHEAYKSDIDATRVSVAKLQEKSDELSNRFEVAKRLQEESGEAPTLTNSKLAKLFDDALLGNLQLDEQVLQGYKEQDQLDKTMHVNFQRLAVREAEVKILEAEEQALRESQKGLEVLLDSMRGDLHYLAEKMSTIAKNSGEVDDDLRKSLREADDELQRIRKSELSIGLAKRAGDIEEALNTSHEQFMEMKRKLDESLLVAGPQDKFGCHYLICMDSGNSMAEGTRWQQSKEAYKNFWEDRSSQQKDDIVTILTFNDDQPVCVIAGEPLANVSQHKLKDISPGGATKYAPVWKAVSQYASDFKDPNRKNVVVFMTAGDADDKGDAACIAEATWSLLASAGGMTTFVISLDAPFQIGFCDELVLAGNNNSREFLAPDGKKSPLAINVKNDTIVDAFRAIASCTSDREEHVKQKMNFIREQRCKEQEQLESDEKAALRRQECMLKEAEKLQKDWEESANQSAGREKSIVENHLRDLELRHNNLQVEIESTEAKLKNVKMECADLASRRDKEQEALNDEEDGEVVALQKKRESIRKQKSYYIEQIAKAQKGKTSLQNNLGNCDAKKLAKAIGYYLQIRENHALYEEELYKGLASIARYVHRVSDDLQAPLTNKFADGAIPHLLLRYFRIDAGLNISGTQANALKDFTTIVNHIGSQMKETDINEAVTAIAEEFDLWELCEITDSSQDESMKQKLMQKLQLSDLLDAAQQAESAASVHRALRNKVKKIEEQLAALPKGDSETRADLAGDLKDAKAEMDASTKDTNAAEAEYRKQLMHCKKFNTAWTLLRKVILAFQATVHDETFMKEMLEVRTQVQGFLEYFRGPVQTYAVTGERMKKEFVKLVPKPSLDNLDGMICDQPFEKDRLGMLQDSDASSLHSDSSRSSKAGPSQIMDLDQGIGGPKAPPPPVPPLGDAQNASQEGKSAEAVVCHPSADAAKDGAFKAPMNKEDGVCESTKEASIRRALTAYGADSLKSGKDLEFQEKKAHQRALELDAQKKM